MRNPSITLACALSLMLSACGGGGGGAGGAQPAPASAAAPLKLTAVTPADGATTGVDAVATASFDAAPAMPTLTAATFSLSSSIGAVDARLALNGSTVSLTPTAPLVWGSRYQLKVSDTVASTAGGKLGASSLTSFDTRMPSWGATAAVDAAAAPVWVGPADDVVMIGSARNGDTVSLWSELRNATTQMVARHYSAASQRWSAAVYIQGNSNWAEGAALSVNGAGNACAIWEEAQDDGRFVVRAARFDAAAGQWSSPLTISNANGPSSRYAKPQVAVGQNGNIIAVWKQYVGGGGGATIDAAYYDAGSQQWTPARPLHGVADTGFPVTAIDPRGNAIVLWSQVVAAPNDYVAHAARYDAGAKAWSTPAIIATTAAGTSFVSKLAFDQAGNAIGVITEYTSPSVALGVVRYSAASNSWSKPQVVDVSTSSSEQLAVDAAGNAMLVWREYNLGRATDTIKSRRYQSSTGTWSELTSIDDRVTSTMPLVVDSAGNFVTAWVGYSETSYALKTMRFNVATGKWDTPTTIAAGAAQLRDPVLTIDQSGQAMLLWPQHSSTGFSDAHIRFSRLTGR
ncbi:Ig-like domain-containing protein [Duganella sp. CF517]|uniref:Ig-like domain-containing protein n=1 Tax=Duganella sp. CF517 TaxID=1881038 RepID=UPI0008D49DDE|nr:Ig-like domain-containing protein [Duganella sp. CF517]SEO19089.1 Ig-like domain-containing protein [Duganella sp. CF517]